MKKDKTKTLFQLLKLEKIYKYCKLLVWGKNELCKPPKNVNKLLFLAVGNLSFSLSLLYVRGSTGLRSVQGLVCFEPGGTQ